ncbi:TPA: tyrosine-type recombinase/integrase [Enterobacter cloacae]|nr:tyrosine-type recombinase/integrase [Enterobacter cloacae]
MPPKRKYLTAAEVEDMLTAAKYSSSPERDYCLLYMSFIHGFRVTELRNLQLSDLSLKEGSLRINRLKQGFCTIHPLLEDETEAIRLWLNVRSSMRGADSDWLFLSRQGKPLTRQRIYQIIRILGERARVEVPSHPHMLRHACGFALADRGIDTRLIQDYLGHRNIRHTVRYTASNSARFRYVWAQKINRKGYI